MVSVLRLGAVVSPFMILKYHCVQPAIYVVVLALGAATTACDGGNRVNVLVPDGTPSFSLMQFDRPLPIDPVPAGWYHRTFFRHPPMDISFVTKEGQPAIRLATNDSASMLFRYVEVPLDDYPLLSWSWYIEQAIESELDEMTVEGDDHPARIFLSFESAEGEPHAMEIIWGNRRLQSGDWKYLQFSRFGPPFPHYVANGGEENVGRWHQQSVDMRALYGEQWGDAEGTRLMAVALFCDTDETGAESIAYFSHVRVERGEDK